MFFGLSTLLSFFLGLAIFFSMPLHAQDSGYSLHIQKKGQSVPTIFPVQPYDKESQDYHAAKRNVIQQGRIEIIDCHGKEIVLEYWDRGKDKLLIIGQGYGNTREVMNAYVGVFYDDYDIVTFNYAPDAWYELLSPFETIFKQKFDNVVEVVHYAKQKKQYQDVIGLGLCYSCYIFVTAQLHHAHQTNEPLFNKLILDSPWMSFEAFMGQSPSAWFHSLHNPENSTLENAGIKAGELLAYLPWAPMYYLGMYKALSWALGDEPFTVYLKDLDNAPVLLVYGNQDVIVSQEDFQSMVDSVTKTDKAILYTPGVHGRNLNRGSYALTIRQFISGSDFFA